MWQRSLRPTWRAAVLMSVLTLVACGPAGSPPQPTAAPAKPAAQAPTTAPAAPNTGAQPTTAPSSASAPAAAPKTEAQPTAAPQAAAPAAKPGGRQTLTVAVGIVARSFDPKSTTGLLDYALLRLVYDTLVTVDSGKPEPWAAESWQAIDAKHWRFVLRPGMTFSNGEPFDANAVKYTLQRALDDPKTPWRERVANIQEMRIVDDRTIDFILDAPVGNLPTRLSVVWIVPPKHTEAQGVTTTPIGSGPFTVSAYTPAQSVVLQARKDYWKGAPKLETVQFRAVPEPSTRVSALLAGDVDVAYLLLPEQLDQVKSRNYEVVSVPTGQSANIFFQTSRETPVANVKVRQAIDYALDKQAIFQGMTNGLGRYLEGQMVSPNSVGYDPSIKARPFDPARAKQLLAEAGYPNGFEVDFDHPAGRYFRDKDVSEAVAGYLQAVGIRAKLNPAEGGAWLDRLYSGTWGPMNYWSIQDAPAYDLSWTMEIFKSANTRKITADPKLDEMINRSFEITDVARRNTHLQEFAQYLYDQTYFIPFHQDPGLYGVSPKVKELSFTPATYIQLLDAYIAE